MSGATLDTVTVVLEWLGPFGCWSDDVPRVFTDAEGDGTGMYLWTVPTPTGFLIQRIGAAPTSLRAAQSEHVMDYLKGARPIHRPASFAEGRLDPVYPGFHGGTRERERQAKSFERDPEQFSAELRSQLAAVRIFIAPTAADLRTQQRIQTGLQRRLVAMGGQEAAFLERPHQHWIRLQGEGAIRVRSVAPYIIRGLEGEFEV